MTIVVTVWGVLKFLGVILAVGLSVFGGFLVGVSLCTKYPG